MNDYDHGHLEEFAVIQSYKMSHAVIESYIIIHMTHGHLEEFEAKYSS